MSTKLIINITLIDITRIFSLIYIVILFGGELSVYIGSREGLYRCVYMFLFNVWTGPCSMTRALGNPTDYKTPGRNSPIFYLV